MPRRYGFFREFADMRHQGPTACAAFLSMVNVKKAKLCVRPQRLVADEVNVGLHPPLGGAIYGGTSNHTSPQLGGPPLQLV